MGFQNSTIHKLRGLVFHMDQIADRYLFENYKIKFIDFVLMIGVFYHQKQNQSCTQKCIADFVNITQAAVSKKIRSLEEKDFILVKNNPQNRRENILELSENGKTVVKKASSEIERILSKNFETLSKEEMDRFDSVLSKLKVSFCE